MARRTFSYNEALHVSWWNKNKNREEVGQTGAVSRPESKPSTSIRPQTSHPRSGKAFAELARRVATENGKALPEGASVVSPPLAEPSRQTDLPVDMRVALPRGSSLHGKLTFDGPVRVDGKLRGEVFSTGILIVSEGASVEGEVTVKELQVHGTVVGTVNVRDKIEISKTGQVKADLKSSAVIVEEGGVFCGQGVFGEVAA